MDLADVFRSHQRDIFTYFLRLTGNRNEAEELAQDCFVRACGAALRFRGKSSVRTWLFGIARLVWLEHLRRPRTQQLLPDDGHAAAHQQDQTEWIHLLEILRSLEPLDRESVVLVDVLGFSPSEAADLLGVTGEAMRVRLHRARRRLRERHDR